MGSGGHTESIIVKSVKIVACDGHSFKDITQLFDGDPDLVKDVDVLGAH